MDLNLDRQFNLCGSLESLAQDLFLDLELMVVAGVLIMAPAARPKITAPGLRFGEAMVRQSNPRVHGRSPVSAR